MQPLGCFGWLFHLKEAVGDGCTSLCQLNSTLAEPVVCATPHLKPHVAAVFGFLFAFTFQVELSHGQHPVYQKKAPLFVLDMVPVK